jgi:hypothetical protein
VKLRMPPTRRVSLAEFSRRYLCENHPAYDKNLDFILGQALGAGQNGFAEHVFLAMVKPEDNLTARYPVLVQHP